MTLFAMAVAGQLHLAVQGTAAADPAPTLRARVTQYALTSANDHPGRDPRDWRLLGSNDAGTNWTVLDSRRAQTFSERYQRREFALSQPAEFGWYRLEIQRVNEPSTENCVQLAELDLLADGQSLRSLPVRLEVQGEFLPMEAREQAFDGDPGTKWLDFANAHPTTRASWLQVQLVKPEDFTVTSLAGLHHLSRRLADLGLPVHIEATLVGTDEARQLCFLIDPTSWTKFATDGNGPQYPAGTPLRLHGRTAWRGAGPWVQDLAWDRVAGETNRLPAAIGPGAFLPPNQGPAWVEVEGRVSFFAEHGDRTSFEIAEGNSVMAVGLVSSAHAPLPPLLNCRVRLRGIAEPLTRPNGRRVAGRLWLVSTNDLRFARPTDEEWAALPLTDLPDASNLLAQATAPRLRIAGELAAANAGETRLRLRHQETDLAVECEQAPDTLPANPVEVVGFLHSDGTTPELRRAFIRSLAESDSTNTASLKSAGAALPLVTNLARVHGLSPKEAAREYPVLVRGVVTYDDPNYSVGFIQDGTRGVYFDAEPSRSMVGEFVELTGVTLAGEFAPMIKRDRIVSLGRGTMPLPLRASFEYLMTGSADCQWVEVSGVVRAARLLDRVPQAELTLVNDRGSFKASVVGITNQAALDRWIDASILIRGVCAAVRNTSRQAVGFSLSAPSLDCVQVVRAPLADPFNLPTLAVSNLLKFSLSEGSLHRVKVEGVVTFTQGERTCYLQDPTGGLRVELQSPGAGVNPGDRVAVVGFQEARMGNVMLGGALVRGLGPAALPEPAAPDLAAILDGGPDSSRVRVQARLVALRGHNALELIWEDRLFRASLADENGVLPALRAGSVLELTGVCRLERDSDLTVRGFELLLAEPADVRVLERPPWWTARHTLGALGAAAFIVLLAVAWIRVLQRRVDAATRQLRGEMEEHKRTASELAAKRRSLELEIEQRKLAEQQAESAHKELVTASRRAGMAEIATGLLHNVGNVLNSVTVSLSVVKDGLRRSKTASLSQAAELLRAHDGDLAAFLRDDARGRQLIPYLEQLARHLGAEQDTLRGELTELSQNVEHLKEIIATQQAYARPAAVREEASLVELVEDALRLQERALIRHDVHVAREYAATPVVIVDRHKVLQILLNLLDNAKHACDDGGVADKQVAVRVAANGHGLARVEVMDNGIGIHPENLIRIFSHGFTTRKSGHGFGLHSAALAARELGGNLTAHSEGAGRGARFTLELPLANETAAVPAQPPTVPVP